MNRIEKLKEKEKQMSDQLTLAHLQMLDFVKKRPVAAALVLEKCAYQDSIMEIADDILANDDLTPAEYQELCDDQDEMQFGIGTINNIFRTYKPDDIETFLTLNFGG